MAPKNITNTVWVEINSPVFTEKFCKVISQLKAEHAAFHQRLDENSFASIKEAKRAAALKFQNNPNDANWRGCCEVEASLKESDRATRERRSVLKTGIKHLAGAKTGPAYIPAIEALKTNIRKAKAAITSRPEVLALAASYGTPVEEVAQPLAAKLDWAISYLDQVLAGCKTGTVAPDSLDEIAKLAAE